MATTGAYAATADNDLNGTGVYTQAAGSSVSSGAATIIAADIDLQGTLNAGAAAVTLRPGLLATTIGVEDASKQFSLTNAELNNITTTGTVTIGQNTNTGGITIGTDALVNQSKGLTFLSTGNIVLAANGLTDAGAVTMTTSGTGAITINGPAGDDRQQEHRADDDERADHDERDDQRGGLGDSDADGRGRGERQRDGKQRDQLRLGPDHVDSAQWDHALRHELGGHDGGVHRDGGQ